METFIGDILTFSIETGIDLSGLTLELLFRKPDGTKGYWNASIDPNDSSIALFTTQQSSLDIKGVWRFQIFAYNNYVKLHGKFFDVKVDEHYDSSIDEV